MLEDAPAISVRDVSKRYGSVAALCSVSFDVQQGRIAGFLGPNGAGKTTMLRILSGALSHDAGSVAVFGEPVSEGHLELRRTIGYMPESAALYGEMRVTEYLRFRAELKGVERSQRKAFIDEAMADCGITDVASRVIAQLSKGYRQRVSLADALVAKPKLLLLDEPTAGLDPNQIRDVRNLLLRLKKAYTVFLSTHILSEVETVADDVVIVHKGRVVAQGKKDLLTRRESGKTFVLALRAEAGPVSKLFRTTVGLADFDVETDGPFVRVQATWDDHVQMGPATERLVAACVASGFGVRDLRMIDARLEDVFAELTRESEEQP